MTFDRQGPQNTEATLKLAMEAAREEGIHKIVVASYSGETALKLAELEHEGHPADLCGTGPGQDRTPGRQSLRGYAAGAGSPGCDDLYSRPCPERRRAGTFRARLGGFGPVEVAAHALRILGQGMKVCVEISMMAADAGLVELHETIVAIGGTGYGSDTAVVIRPAPTAEFLDSKVDRIICMPRKN